ncbi:thymidine kinase [Flexilinea flocculi]|jgi:thymidine kinase|uniref:Thymidine kinase n=1 Tax=Flexilinea flocculi TaxID=1678840 RepID=A0A0S7BLT4_9CHLR|nr:thymidine kinase [Flexilinea flocculi]GAP41276.1 thymidine kinase [Flexilinea flocculi]
MVKNSPGTIEVICGSMFCGKTEELIRRLRRAIIAKNQVQVFKPIIDNRYVVERVHSHAGIEIDAAPISDITEIYHLLDSNTSVIGIDEAQFFSDDIVHVVDDLSEKGIRVVLAGLDMDFRGEPFGMMPILMSKAEKVDKLYAICMVCGEPATRTQRLVDGKPANYHDPIVIVGASEMYEARCRKHHIVPGK